MKYFSDDQLKEYEIGRDIHSMVVRRNVDLYKIWVVKSKGKAHSFEDNIKMAHK